MSSIGNWRGPNIVKDGLVLYIDPGSPNSYYDKYSTTIKDISGNNSNITLINSPAYQDTNGGRLYFDGTNEYAIIPSVILLNNSIPKTFSFWCQSLAGSGGTLIADMGFTANRGWLISIGTEIRFGGSNNGSNANLIYRNTTNANISNGNWYNIVVTYDPSVPTALFYLNGVLLLDDGGTIYNTYRNSTAFTLIGGYSSGPVSSLFKGMIANFLQYDKVLTQQEVLQNYNALKSRFGL